MKKSNPGPKIFQGVVIIIFLNGCLMGNHSEGGHGDHGNHNTPIQITEIPGDTPTTKSELFTRGETIFSTVCSSCHQPDAQGVPGSIPPLANSDYLMTDTYRAINVLVEGLSGEIVVNGQTYNGQMPKIVASDSDIASVLTYIRNQFNGATDSVTTDDVVRAKLP